MRALAASSTAMFVSSSFSTCLSVSGAGESRVPQSMRLVHCGWWYDHHCRPCHRCDPSAFLSLNKVTARRCVIDLFRTH